MDVTLIDAFKIKEINLLIGSYVFSMCHNLYILKSSQYVGINMSTEWFALGGMCGIVVSGAVVDLVFKKRRFLTILLLNVFITCFDIYLYTQENGEVNIGYGLTFALGAVMSSVSIIYLILLPMLIAKQHSEEMAAMGEFARVSYAGTIVGVVIALCAVGRYLFSDNLATLLDFWTNGLTSNAYSDTITSVLQLITILIILGPIRHEFKDSSHIFKSITCCCKKKQDEDEGEETEIYNWQSSNSLYMRNTTDNPSLADPKSK